MTSALTIIDYLFIAVFALAFPLVGLINYRKLQRQMEQGVAVKAHQLYWHTIIGQWLLLAVGLVAWLFQGRSWSAMGFVTSMPAGFTAGLVLALLVIVGLCWQLRQIFQYTPEQKSTLAEQFHSLAALLPRSRKDLLTFYGLSVTAGIVEEIIWRGMLIWYLGHFVPLWLAGVVSAVGFGLAHSYQGMEQVPKIVVMGGIFSAVFLLTGSIWVPIILHIAVDVLQGRLAFEVLRSDVPNAKLQAAS